MKKLILFLLIAASLNAALVHTSTWDGVGSDTSSSKNSTPTATTAGNTLAVFAFGYTMQASSSCVLTDTAGDTFMLAAQGYNTSGTRLYIANGITANAANVIAFACTGGPSYVLMVAREYSGLDPVAPIDITANGQVLGGTTLASNPFTTASPNDIIVAGVGVENTTPGVFSLGTGYSNLFSGPWLGTEDKSVSSIQTNVTASMSWVSGSNAVILVAALKLAPSPSTNTVLFEGDSITAGYVIGPTNSYPYLWSVSFPTPYAPYFVTARSGDRVGDLVSKLATDEAILMASAGPPVETILIGANDLNTITPTAFVAALKAYCLTIKSAIPSLRIIIIPVLPQTTAGFNVNRNQANTLIASDASWYDVFVSWAEADTMIYCDSCAGNATYYFDGIHLTAAGQGILMPYVKSALDAVLGIGTGQTTVIVSGTITF